MALPQVWRGAGAVVAGPWATGNGFSSALTTLASEVLEVVFEADDLVVEQAVLNNIANAQRPLRSASFLVI